MPPKSKRRKNIEESLRCGRETKQRRANASNDTPSTDPMGLHSLFVLEDEAQDTDSETVDPSFDQDVSMMSDTEHLISTFCEEWVASLTWENRTSLGLFLTFQSSTLLGKGETEAAELAAQMIGRSDRTIRGWRSKFFASGGELPINEQGHYQRSGMLWKDESLCKKASRFIRANAALKGNQTSLLAHFVNRLMRSCFQMNHCNQVSLTAFTGKLPENGCIQWDLWCSLGRRGPLLMAMNDQML